MRSRCTHSPSIFSALYLREQDTGQGLHLVILFCRAHCGQFYFRCGNGSVWAALFENHLPGLPHHRRQFYVHHGFSSHRQKSAAAISVPASQRQPGHCVYAAAEQEHGRFRNFMSHPVCGLDRICDLRRANCARSETTESLSCNRFLTPPKRNSGGVSYARQLHAASGMKLSGRVSHVLACQWLSWQPICAGKHCKNNKTPRRHCVLLCWRKQPCSRGALFKPKS